jgi:hypothetical protein
MFVVEVGSVLKSRRSNVDHSTALDFQQGRAFARDRVLHSAGRLRLPPRLPPRLRSKG